MPNPNALTVVADPQTWDAHVETGNGHLLQSFGWGELKSRFGWSGQRVAWQEGGNLRGLAQILYRHLAPALTLAYVPRGPVVTDGADLSPFLDRLVQHVRGRGVFLLKLEPDWHRGDERDEVLRRARFVPTQETVQPPATIHLDLTADLETILARMKSKWRYNIRLAEKKGVSVHAGDAADFDAFYELMRVTGQRDEFAIHGPEYYRTAFEFLQRGDHVRLLIAEFEQKPLAMIFVTAFAHEAIYLYGASGNEERNRMPNHALHWAAIRWARERGCARYDLWGIPETMVETSDDSNLPTSLYQFKQGFGGEIVRYSGAWDLVFGGARHQAYKLARSVYRREIS